MRLMSIVGPSSVCVHDVEIGVDAARKDDPAPVGRPCGRAVLGRGAVARVVVTEPSHGLSLGVHDVDVAIATKAMFGRPETMSDCESSARSNGDVISVAIHHRDSERSSDESRENRSTWKAIFRPSGDHDGFSSPRLAVRSGDDASAITVHGVNVRREALTAPVRRTRLSQSTPLLREVLAPLMPHYREPPQHQESPFQRRTRPDEAGSSAMEQNRNRLARRGAVNRINAKRNSCQIRRGRRGSRRAPHQTSEFTSLATSARVGSRAQLAEPAMARRSPVPPSLQSREFGARARVAQTPERWTERSASSKHATAERRETSRPEAR